MEINKIISGGQTGVDRAALDVAIKTDLPFLAPRLFARNTMNFKALSL